jgi:ketosteroid isomerase-like protein
MTTVDATLRETNCRAVENLVALFRLRNGQVVSMTEYVNPLVLQAAFA